MAGEKNYSKMDMITHDALVKLCTDYYESKYIEESKYELFRLDSVVTLDMLKRRQGPNKDKANVEDILAAIHKCTSGGGYHYQD